MLYLGLDLAELGGAAAAIAERGVAANTDPANELVCEGPDVC